MRKYVIQIVIVLMVLIVPACQDAWENHSDIADTTASKTILELLEQDANYSHFVAALKETGLDKDLTETKMYTVWAPSNSKLTNLPENDSALYQLVSNHINSGNLKTRYLNGHLRIKMLSGKVLDVDGASGSIDQINISKKDQPAKNGIIQFIDGPLQPRLSVWEYIARYSGQNKHISYLNSLSGEVFDPEVADIIGYKENGQPIYDTISGMVWKNSFLEEVADLRVEDSTYTLLVIDDAAFTSEFEMYTPYFKVSSGSSEQDQAKNKAKCEYKITKDYVTATAYDAANIPGTITSVDMVEVPVEKASIYQSFKASNGWVHHISSCSVPLANKIKPIVVEGETLERFIDNYTIYGDDIDGYPAGYKRVRPEALGGFDYVLDNWTTNVKGSGLILHADEVASMTYKFYLKAVNDFRGSYKNPKGEDYVLRQKLGVTTLISEHNMIYDFNPMIAVSDTLSVTAMSYDEAVEEEVGQYKFTSMRDVYLWLQSVDYGAGVTADYIKLVPDFN